MFKLSKRSLNNLYGVNPQLVEVVTLAITRTEVDFGVIEGLRTRERQEELVRAGASKTMNSRHITGDAVDLLAYVGNRGSWELPLYYPIAEAMAASAAELGVPIRWGAAWHWPDISVSSYSMQALSDEYIDLRRSQGRKAFVDAPHFEIPA